MPETWITREQARRLYDQMGKLPEWGARILAELGVNVETDPAVADDELSALTMYKMGHAHGYFAGVAVCWEDIRAQLPWLTREQWEDLAANAAELAGDNDMSGDLRADAIDESVRQMEEDAPGSTWDPRTVDGFTAKDGKRWHVVQRGGDEDDIEIACDDGRMFVSSGGEWDPVDVEQEQGAADAPA